MESQSSSTKFTIRITVRTTDTSTTYSLPADGKYMPDNPLKIIETTNVLILVTPTITLYKSVVKYQYRKVSQPESTKAKAQPPTTTI